MNFWVEFRTMSTLLQKENIEDVYPMSDIQLGMVYHTLRESGTSVYHNQLVFQRKDSSFDPGILRKTIYLLVDKHPMLRTGFNINGYKEPLQIVFKKIVPDIQHEDISQMNRTKQQEYVKAFLTGDMQRAFKLTSPGLLWRMKTFALGDGAVCFIWACHHAITDGWSSASLMTELYNTYMHLKSDPHYSLKKLKNTYKQFVLEQRVEKKNKKTIKFWQEELADYKRLNFPGAEPGEVPFTGKKVYSVDLGGKLRQGLLRTAKKEQTSFKNLCFAAYIYMLSMLSYDNDIVAGLVTHNRPVCEDGEKIFGCFLNTLPVRIKIPASSLWYDYLKILDNKLLELENYNRLSLLEIVKLVGEENRQQNPIFDSFFNFVDFHVYNQVEELNESKSGQGENQNVLAVDQKEEANTLFNCDVYTTAGTFAVKLTYSSTIISDRLVRNLVYYFERVLNNFVNNLQGKADKETLLTEQERKELLIDFNRSETLFPADKTVHRLFEEQAVKAPDRIAFVYEDNQMSYKEYDKESERLARLLIGKGVRRGDIISLLLEPSFDMLTGIMGTLKAGAGYVPIDPGNPAGRIDHILNHSQATLLLSRYSLKDRINFAREVVFLDKVKSGVNMSENAKSSGAANMPVSAAPTDLIYIIFTSGSTGKPKGVMVEHRGVVNYIKWAEKMYIRGEAYDLPLFTSYSFDLTVTSLYLPLISANKIVIYKQKDSEPVLYRVIREDRVQVVKLTPAHLKMVKEFAFVNSHIKKLIVGGEELLTVLAADIYRKFQEKIDIYNEYGPTETVVGCMIYKFDPEKDKSASVPIGRPVDNMQLFILDRCQKLLPPGVQGELYVSGVGIARGYEGRPEITHRSFADNPFRPGQRLYRTGDIARALPGGCMEFYGRSDQQVKIRGFRIELGEIEDKILQYEKIKDALVVPVPGKKGESCLSTYFVSDSEIDAGALRDYLAGFLPSYMIPDYFMQVKEIPLTPAGKVDKKALPEPELILTDEYIPPQNEIEQGLIEIWSQVLDLDEEQIGIDHNFFDLGGNSLAVIQLNSRLREVYKKDIPVAKMFTYTTVRTLAGYLSRDSDRSISWRDDSLQKITAGKKKLQLLRKKLEVAANE